MAIISVVEMDLFFTFILNGSSIVLEILEIKVDEQPMNFDDLQWSVATRKSVLK